MTKMTVRTAFQQPGFAALAGGLLCCLCVRDMPQFLAIVDLNAIPVTQYLLAALRGAVFLVVLAALSGPGWGQRFARGGALAWAPVSLAMPLAFAGLACIAFGSAPAVRMVGCALLGAGQSLFLLSWILRLFEVSKRTMFYALMVAAAGAGAVEMLLAVVDPVAEEIIALAFPLGSWAAQMCLLRRGGVRGLAASGVGAQGADASVGEAHRDSGDRAADQAESLAGAANAWLPQGPGEERTFALSAGVAATLFTYFAYSFVIRQLTDTWMAHGAQGSLMLFQLLAGAGTALSAGAIYSLFHLRKSRKSPATYTAFALPLLVAALYLSTFLTGQLSIVYVLPLFVMRKMLLVLVIAGALYYRQGVDRTRFFAAGFVCIEAASVSQTAFFEFAKLLPEHGDTACSLAVFVLIAFIAVREINAYVNGNSDASAARESFATAPDAAPVVVGATTEQLRHDAVLELQAEFGLTARETEVAELLATGRNAEYIAKELFVAHSTAKSHIAHIYQKTGLNSQQRLMDLVEERMGK